MLLEFILVMSSKSRRRKKAIIPEVHDSPVVKHSRSLFASRRGLRHVSPLPLRRGQPLSAEAFIGDGIIPHNVISTDRILQDKDIYLFYENLYRSDPVVSVATDDLTDYTWQSLYKIRWDEQIDMAKKIAKWMRHSFYDLIWKDATRWAYLTGDGYIWLDFRQKTGKRGRPRLTDKSIITDMKVLHPAYMYVQIDQHGDLIGYVQRLSLLREGWAFFRPDEIVHLTYKRLPDRVYGTSLAECILRDLHYLRYSEYTIAEVFHDYIAPLLHVACGYDNAPGGGQRPAGDPALDKVKDQFENLAQNEDIITDNTVKINPINTGRNIGDYKPALDHFSFNTKMGTKLPHWFFGETQRITEASAIVMKEIVEKLVSPMQTLIALSTERNIFPYILVALTKKKLLNMNRDLDIKNRIDENILNKVLTVDMIDDVPEMVWNPVESFQQKTDRLLKELNAGGLTMNQYAEEMGRPHIEHELADLPIPLIQYETTLLQLQAKQAIIQQGGNNPTDKDKGKGQRTPKKKKPNTETVDETGQPKAKDTKTHPRGKRKDRKVK
jgi:hypothetical protein